MMYKYRPGIVKVKICDSYVLVPTRAASEQCPRVRVLGLLSAALWEEIGKGHDGSVVALLLQRLAKKSEEQAREKVDLMLQDLYEEGFLIKEDEPE